MLTGNQVSGPLGADQYKAGNELKVMGQGMGTRTKMPWRKVTVCELWHGACQHGWPVLELAQTGAGQGVYIVFSKCEKILRGKLRFCSFPSLLCRAEHKDIDIRFDCFKRLRSWETQVMHRCLCQSTCPGSRWRNSVLGCVSVEVYN